MKDNQDEISETLRKLSRLTYPQLEIIVAVDRSTDRTEQIVRDIQARDARVKPVVIHELPQGWLGKVHALHLGSSSCQGDFILLLDADLAISDEDLWRAIQEVRQKKLDHLSIVPRVFPRGFLHDVMMCTSTILFISSSRPWTSIKKRPTKSVKGMGKFNLVRRSQLLETEGVEWLKMDVADDVALAQLIARSGGRSLLYNADSLGPDHPHAAHLSDTAASSDGASDKGVVWGFGMFYTGSDEPSVFIFYKASALLSVVRRDGVAFRSLLAWIDFAQSFRDLLSTRRNNLEWHSLSTRCTSKRCSG